MSHRSLPVIAMGLIVGLQIGSVQQRDSIAEPPDSWQPSLRKAAGAMLAEPAKGLAAARSSTSEAPFFRHNRKTGSHDEILATAHWQSNNGLESVNCDDSAEQGIGKYPAQPGRQVRVGEKLGYGR